MKTLLSVRIDDQLLQALKAHALRLHLSQTDYVKQAIELMNQKIEQEERKQRLEKASQLVRKESMSVNKDFSEIEDDPDA